MNSGIRRQEGFTMLEVLIALMVFALISMMAWQIIHGAMENAAFTDKETANLSQLQLTYSRLERDLTQIVPRPVHGDDQAFHATAQSVAFTTQDNLAAFGQPRQPDLLRVTWLLEKNTLWREFSPALDLATATEGTRVPVLEHVKAWQWRFFNQGWQNDWTSKTTAPQGAELIVTLENDQQWRWVFVTTQGWPMAEGDASDETAPAEGEPAPDEAQTEASKTPEEGNKPAPGANAAPGQPTNKPQGGTQ